MSILICYRIREKGPNTCFFKFSQYKIYLGPLKRISYALEIGTSIMELRWSEFLVMCIFKLHTSTLMLFPGKFQNITLGPFSWIQTLFINYNYQCYYMCIIEYHYMWCELCISMAPMLCRIYREIQVVEENEFNFKDEVCNCCLKGWGGGGTKCHLSVTFMYCPTCSLLFISTPWPPFSLLTKYNTKGRSC